MDEEECHVCGQPADGEGFIEGARVSLCEQCMKYAKRTTFFEYEEERPRKKARMEAEAITTKPKPAAKKELELVEDYSQRIHEARQARGWSRKQLGAKLFIREVEIAAFEEGRLKPIESIAKKLEHSLGIRLLEETLAVEERVEDVLGKRKSKSGAAPSLADVVEIKKKTKN